MGKKKGDEQMEQELEEPEMEDSIESNEDAKEVIDLPGVGAATAEKLRIAGYDDLMSIAVATPGELIEASGVNEAMAKKIIAAARTSLKMGFESGEDFLIRRQKVNKISTGSVAFDKMVGGGFETGAITEIYSAYGGGKTQIAHMLAINVQKAFDDAVVVFIDTESTFRPERIIQIAQAAGLDPHKVLQNIKVARAYNSDHQMLLAEKVEDLIKKQHLNVKLVIVDSLTSHFRAEFVGRGTLADRQQKLNKHMHVLARLADLNNLCVYVTNQVMARPDMFFGDPTEAIGGHIVGHNSQTRIYIRKGKKGSRVAKLVDSPSLPDGEVSFYVTEGGLKDI
ncbi:MAG TPA: DNA repair and recombination protein RadA [Candidatus Nanoarchaeia archaeon]|nr:DNA repair and recombination protein RadA [Candidatus Nanoarchaeia archaeon]